MTDMTSKTSDGELFFKLSYYNQSKETLKDVTSTKSSFTPGKVELLADDKSNISDDILFFKLPHCNQSKESLRMPPYTPWRSFNSQTTDYEYTYLPHLNIKDFSYFSETEYFY